MAQISTNMGLKIWDLPTDDFSRTELANNWAKVDTHDHSPGNGNQIDDEGIEDGAITTGKIGASAVTAAKIGAEAVTSAKIQDLAVTVGKLGAASVITEKIQDGAVQTAKIGDGQVTGAKVADNTLTGAKLIDGAISTGKLADLAVSAAKLGSAAVTTTKVADANITEPKMADCSVTARVICDGQIGPQHLDPDLIPVGQVIDWWRPDDTVSVPAGGWEIADGSVLSGAEHDFPGIAGSVTLPDLRNRFILGAATSGTDVLPSTPPAIGIGGGGNTRDLSHTHVHSHTHGVVAHTHGIANDAHSHMFIDPIDLTLHHFQQRGSGVKLRADDPGSTWRQGAYLPGVNSAFAPNTTHDSGPILMNTHNHSHGGGTTASAPSTGDASPTTTASSGSATQDIRPAFVGLLKLIKVRNT